VVVVVKRHNIVVVIRTSPRSGLRLRLCRWIILAVFSTAIILKDDAAI